MKCALIILAASILSLQAAPPKSRVSKPPVPVFTESPSGLKYADLRVGKGEQPKVGQICAMLYKGWLYENKTKGKLFDSCETRKKPFEFPVGMGRVIKGWDEGVLAMKVGGKRMLVIPPELGYGARGAGGVIPPNATLMFEVELLSVKGEAAAK